MTNLELLFLKKLYVELIYLNQKLNLFNDCVGPVVGKPGILENPCCFLSFQICFTRIAVIPETKFHRELASGLKL